MQILWIDASNITRTSSDSSPKTGEREVVRGRESAKKVSQTGSASASLKDTTLNCLDFVRSYLRNHWQMSLFHASFRSPISIVHQTHFLLQFVRLFPCSIRSVKRVLLYILFRWKIIRMTWFLIELQFRSHFECCGWRREDGLDRKIYQKFSRHECKSANPSPIAPQRHSLLRNSVLFRLKVQWVWFHICVRSAMTKPQILGSYAAQEREERNLFAWNVFKSRFIENDRYWQYWW